MGRQKKKQKEKKGTKKTKNKMADLSPNILIITKNANSIIIFI